MMQKQLEKSSFDLFLLLLTVLLQILLYQLLITHAGGENRVVPSDIFFRIFIFRSFILNRRLQNTFITQGFGNINVLQTLF